MGRRREPADRSKRLSKRFAAMLRAVRTALDTAPLGEPLLLVALAVLTGAVGGLGAVVFRLMIRLGRLFFVGLLVGRGLSFTGALHPWLYALTPALGLLAVGVITHRFAREVKGHGVPQILEALALRRGRIRPRVGFFGILAPAITIGARGSVGREGPIALIGAAFGSLVGQTLRLSDQYTSLLLACGAAAGIGSTFNAPIAGGLFGLEVVLGSYAMGALVPVFVASVVGVVVFRALLGNQLVMPTPQYVADPTAVAAMLALGLLGGGVALAYSRGLYLVEEWSEGWRLGWGWQALAAGIAVGVIGLWFPQVLGVGYRPMEATVVGHYGLLLLLGLLVGKYVTTLLTIGGGGSGGVFAPSLFLGAALGGVFGACLHALFPALSGPPALYAVAGMGVVFSGAAQAPLTAMVIILEMTGDYHLTVAVAGACAISYLLYGSLARDSMYTVMLSHRGVRVLRGAEVRPLQQVPVTSAMQPLGPRLYADDTVAVARTAMATVDWVAMLVFRRDGTLQGIVDDIHLLHASDEGRLQQPVGEVCRTGVPVLSPEASLDDAMRRFGILTTDLLPVGADAAHVQGTVSRADVLRAYYNRTVLTLETKHKVELLRDVEPRLGRGAFREVTLPQDWSGAGRPIGGLDLGPGAVVVSVARGTQSLVPLGDTQLAPGDRVLFHAIDLPTLERAEGQLLAAAPRRRGLFDYFRLPEHWAPEGRTPASLHLPPGVVLVSLQRGDQLIVPRGDTLLHAGDAVTVCAEDAASLARAREALLASPAGSGPPGR